MPGTPHKSESQRPTRRATNGQNQTLYGNDLRVNSIRGGVEAAGLLIDGYVGIPRAATVAYDASRSTSHTYRHLVNSIEGGTAEVMHNILSERVLGPAGESRIDRDIPRWEVCQS